MDTQHSIHHAQSEDGRAYLDYDCALEILEALVAERGDDFIYEAPGADGDGNPGCAYAVEDEAGNLSPSCGVGYVVHAVAPHLLPRLHRLDPGEHRYTGVAAEPALRDYLPLNAEDGLGLVVDSRALFLLKAFQFHQDARVPYRESLRRAVADERIGILVR